MHQFNLIVGAGHNGSMWFANVLNQRKDTNFYHRLRQEMLHMSWQQAARVHINSMELRPYWSRLKGEAHMVHVGDANAWAPFEVPDVHRQILVNRVYYLVRNGISQVQSLYTTSVWKDNRAQDFATDVWLRRYWDIGRRPAPDWPEWSRFERVCLLWASVSWMAPWLRGQGFTVDVLRLEDLVSGDTLGTYVPHLSGEELASLQKKKLNKHVKGGRHPNWIWNTWTKDYRASFIRICGKAMLDLGYEMPEVK